MCTVSHLTHPVFLCYFDIDWAYNIANQVQHYFPILLRLVSSLSLTIIRTLQCIKNDIHACKQFVYTTYYRADIIVSSVTHALFGVRK